MKTLINVLLLSLLLTACGTRKTKDDLTKAQNEVKSELVQRNNSENSENSETTTNEVSTTEKSETEKVKETVEKFDADGKLTERKTTETERKKDNKGKDEKNSSEKKHSKLKSENSEKSENSVNEKILQKHKEVVADKTIATNFGGWGSLFLFGVLAISAFFIYRKFIR